MILNNAVTVDPFTGPGLRSICAQTLYSIKDEMIDGMTVEERAVLVCTATWPIPPIGGLDEIVARIATTEEADDFVVTFLFPRATGIGTTVFSSKGQQYDKLSPLPCVFRGLRYLEPRVPRHVATSKVDSPRRVLITVGHVITGTDDADSHYLACIWSALSFMPKPPVDHVQVAVGAAIETQRRKKKHRRRVVDTVASLDDVIFIGEHQGKPTAQANCKLICTRTSVSSPYLWMT